LFTLGSAINWHNNFWVRVMFYFTVANRREYGRQTASGKAQS
jgi:hypothetical protein